MAQWRRLRIRGRIRGSILSPGCCELTADSCGSGRPQVEMERCSWKLWEAEGSRAGALTEGGGGRQSPSWQRTQPSRAAGVSRPVFRGWPGLLWAACQVPSRPPKLASGDFAKGRRSHFSKRCESLESWVIFILDNSPLGRKRPRTVVTDEPGLNPTSDFLKCKCLESRSYLIHYKVCRIQ